MVSYMEDKNKHLFYIVAMLAIVAIFALVFMTMKSTQQVKYVVMDTEGNSFVTDQAGMAMIKTLGMTNLTELRKKLTEAGATVELK